MKRAPPLVVLILGGAAGRWGCAAAASPLASARAPHLEGLAREGRVLGVRLARDGRDACTMGPLLSLLGFDPAAVETARASYLGALTDEELAAEECFVSADFIALFRDLVADVDPGLRPQESEILLRAADAATRRAGFRLIAGAGSNHLAVAPRASVDASAPPPPFLLGRALAALAPLKETHAFAHRLAREVLDGHEINEVRRDLGRNGADAIWFWGPGGAADLRPAWDMPVSALGSDAHWRGLCKAARIPLRMPQARTPAGLVRGIQQALRNDGLCFLYARRGVSDALKREAKLRADGVADLDRHLVGPVAKAVGGAGARLLVVPDAAYDTESGSPLGDPVPALLWGAGISALRQRPFTEAGAAEAGDPVEPGHGLLAYVRHL